MISFQINFVVGISLHYLKRKITKGIGLLTMTLLFKNAVPGLNVFPWIFCLIVPTFANAILKKDILHLIKINTANLRIQQV